jgi:hypothetical protein
MDDIHIEEDGWRLVTLNSVSKDGYNRSTAHTHEGEVKNLRDDILEELDEVDVKSSEYMFDEEEHKKPEHPESDDISLLPRDLSHQIVALFSLSTGIMENQTEMILRNTVLSDDQRYSKITDDMLDQPLSTKLDWVSGLPESEDFELSHASDVRKKRNRLVHEPKERLHISDLAEFKGSIKKTVRAPEQLYQLYLSVTND